MKDVYIKNPQMGDPASVDPRLSEIGQTIDKLQAEIQKFEVCPEPEMHLLTLLNVNVGRAVMFVHSQQ